MSRQLLVFNCEQIKCIVLHYSVLTSLEAGIELCWEKTRSNYVGIETSSKACVGPRTSAVLPCFPWGSLLKARFSPGSQSLFSLCEKQTSCCCGGIVQFSTAKLRVSGGVSRDDSVIRQINRWELAVCRAGDAVRSRPAHFVPIMGFSLLTLLRSRGAHRTAQPGNVGALVPSA